MNDSNGRHTQFMSGMDRDQIQVGPPPHHDETEITLMAMEKQRQLEAGENKWLNGVTFIDTHPVLAPAVIDGLLRKGETANIIGSTKAGKSWMILGLALSIAQGRPWLGREVKQGKVALIDNELQAGTLSSRLSQVAHQMVVPKEVLEEFVLIRSLRGEPCGIGDLAPDMAMLADEGVVMVGMDAFYRLIPQGTSENDNAQMTLLYNKIDEYASTTGAAFVLNHHASKGDQTTKGVTDVGSGAGAISRAVDTHLIIRPHKEPELAVLDAAVRSFPPVEPSSLRYEFPVWMESSEQPELAERKTQANTKQAANDEKGKTQILSALELAGDWVARRSAARKSGMGAERFDRLVFTLVEDGLVVTEERPRAQRKNEFSDHFKCAK